MANYKGHLAGGFVAYGLLFFCAMNNYVFSWTMACEWLLCTLLGSLFPDIDIKSKIQTLFYQSLCIAFIVLCIQKRFATITFLSIPSLMPLIVKHRGIFHSFWFLLSITGSMLAYVYVFFPSFFPVLFFDSLFFMIGVISHLMLDRGLIRWARF